ncbi:MAG: hypothetical protein K2Q15_10425, partial [Burkholderiales bacterium]|nr:hypothetical protein [Burkholderiales bacterium]
LLTSNGILIITLRHGEFTDGRTAFPLSVDELQILSKQYGLSNILCTEQRIDQLGRSGVFWQTLVFRLEDRI